MRGNKGPFRHIAATALAFCAAAYAGPKSKSAYPWDKRPTMEDLYRDYDPMFSQHGRSLLLSQQQGGSMREQIKFSRQDSFINMADVQMDSQVWPIIKKGNEEMQKGEPRRATELYLRILKEYPDDLCQIAKEGIFIPAWLYVQRRILMYPETELSYFRMVFNPAAKDIYERAVKRYSIFDYKDIVKYHLATSYGDDALFALGNAALDNGMYDEARRCYEQIVTYHGLQDTDGDEIKLDRDQVWVRLAICYRYLGDEAEYRAVAGKIRQKSGSAKELFDQLEKMKYDEFDVRQREGRRSARYDAMDDRKLSEPMPYPFSANKGEWQCMLAQRPVRYPRSCEPEALPWATETDIIYKDMNVLFSRSMFTGELNWVFAPGGSSFDWDRYIGAHSHRTLFYPAQSILVHEGAAFAHMFVYGPSLVAVDQNTGRLLWAKGPMAATTEDEWLDRYQACPAAGRGMIIAPVVHDDIRGLTHISSTAELAAYETTTGKLLWRTWLSRISPLKITQSHYPRKIRILSTTPLVKDGVAYHVTNAGVVAAVDAETGDVRWITRYPQKKEVLDNFSTPDRIWRNEPPLIRSDKLYVTPVDSSLLLCLDKDTGRIVWAATQDADAAAWVNTKGQGRIEHVWRMNGFNSAGEIALSGMDLAFLHPDSGKLVNSLGLSGFIVRTDRGGAPRVNKSKVPKGLDPGITGEGEDFWFSLGSTHAPTVSTRDGKVCFTMQEWFGDPGPGQNPFNSEYTYDVAGREIILQRRWYHPSAFIFRYGYADDVPIVRRPVNEEPEEFNPPMRMSFNRLGVPFEVDVTFNHMATRYDRKKLEGVLAQRNDLEAMFAKAELARKTKDVKGSIALYEKCKQLLPSEEEDRRRNINLRLYPLYTELARWGHQSEDMAFLEGACKKMGATATNPTQEIRALLAYAELHRKRGDYEKALGVLQNVSKHYWREPLVVSGLEVGRKDELMAKAMEALGNLLGEIPKVYGDVGKQLYDAEKGALGDYFMAVANVDEGHVVETRNVIAKRIVEMVGGAPEEFRRKYEELARDDLKRYEGLEEGERGLWCWAGSAEGKKKIAELSGKTGSLKGAEKRGWAWRLDDLGEACGFGTGLAAGGREGLEDAGTPAMENGAGRAAKEEKNEDPDVVRLVLKQRGEVGKTAHLLFVGGRKKMAYGNRFTVMCHNMREDRKEWESREILLHGKTMAEEGYEVGFEEVFIQGGLAVVHGRYDVIGLEWESGKSETKTEKGTKKEKAWHFRVPLGFEIMAAGMKGEVLVLSGRGSSIGLWVKDGEIIWEEAEAGEYYAGPYFDGDVAIGVRKSPSEVSFRKVGTGRLLSRVKMAGLTMNQKHPIYQVEGTGSNPAAAESAEEYPVGFGGGILAVTDGMTFHVVDVRKREIAWSTPATKLDLSVDPSYRLWVDSGRVYVLKPYFSVLENCVFDGASGDMLWRRREGGKKQEDKLKKFSDEEKEAKEGKAATGLVLSSMAFVGGKVYGIKYEMTKSAVTLVGMDGASGNEIMKVTETGYTDAEAYIEESWSRDCVVVRVQDGNKYEVWQVDVKQGKIAQKLELEGYGRLGQYGDVSAAWQGPNIALWAYEKRKIAGK